jgi:hypothetical protein
VRIALSSTFPPTGLLVRNTFQMRRKPATIAKVSGEQASFPIRWRKKGVVFI